MKRRHLLTMSLFALLLICSPLVASASHEGHSRHHQKHDKHHKHRKYVKHHKHRYHDDDDHHHHHHHYPHPHPHDHEHVVIVESYKVIEPGPRVGVQVEMNSVTIQGEVLF